MLAGLSVLPAWLAAGLLDCLSSCLCVVVRCKLRVCRFPCLLDWVYCCFLFLLLFCPCLSPPPSFAPKAAPPKYLATVPETMSKLSPTLPRHRWAPPILGNSGQVINGLTRLTSRVTTVVITVSPYNSIYLGASKILEYRAPPQQGSYSL